MLSVKAIPLYRRLLILAVTLACSGILFRAPIAVALVTRGDGFFQKGQPARALPYYARAMRFDQSELAADRYAFAAMLARRPGDIAQGIAVASRALTTHPDDVALLTDRALLLQLQHSYALAAADFTRVAALTHDARMYHFAAWSAFRAHQRSKARNLWRAALTLDRAFAPAHLALLRYGRPL